MEHTDTVDTFDTWLTEADIDRLWRVTSGELNEVFATAGELEEFALVLAQAAARKWGLEGATIH